MTAPSARTPTVTGLADSAIAALRSHHEDLAARVRGFDDDDLARESGASEWPVAQVLSHLGGGAEITLAGLQATAAGGERPGRDFNGAVWDRWNAMTPQEQAEEFLAANEALVSAFANLDSSARRDIRIDLGFLPFPADLALFSGMRLNEAALHGRDVRVAFDTDAALPASEAAIALDLLTGPLSFLLGFQAKTDILDGRQVTVRVVTTNPDRVHGLILRDKAELGDETENADAVLTTPAEAFVRLLAGRLGPAHTPDAVTLTGDSVTLDQLRTVFPGY
jgi:uncharacterized protein (TIGR03083 family)